MSEKHLRGFTLFVRTLASIAMVLLFLNSFFIVLNIILRKFFNAPIIGATEIMRYTSLLTVCFAMADNDWAEGNVNMTLLLDALPVKARQIILGVINLVTAAGFVVITVLMYKQFLVKAAGMACSVELRIPDWFIYAVLTFGFAVMTIVVGLKGYLYLWMAKTGKLLSFRALSNTEFSKKGGEK